MSTDTEIAWVPKKGYPEGFPAFDDFEYEDVGFTLPILLQDELWIDRNHVCHKLEDLKLKHIIHIRAMLLRERNSYGNARVIQAREEFRSAQGVDFDHTELLKAIAVDPETWLRSCPLILRINELVTDKVTEKIVEKDD